MAVVVHYAGNPGRAKEVVETVAGAGSTAVAVRADVADENE